jgi:hypothetical protein
MGRVFISVGHGGLGNSRISLESGGVEASEIKEMILLRDLAMQETRSRNLEVLSVPDDLSLEQTIQWINYRHRPGDIAVELYAETHANPAFRGAGVYYIAHNRDRKQHADLLLLALTRRVPQIAIRAALADTTSGLGYLPFCRQLIPASLQLQIGVFSNAEDRSLIQNRRQELALGIADGLITWSRFLTGKTTMMPKPSPSAPQTPSYPSIPINLNGRLYGEQGILINGNAWIPIDLVDRLGVTPHQMTQSRRVSYGGIVYVKAIDLRDSNLSVSWDTITRTVSVRSILQIGRQLNDITGKGYTSEVQLLMFLKTHNEAGLAQFPDIARLYREEAIQEGISYDIAFAQLCVETDFLRFGRMIKPSQNNFGGLGTTHGTAEGAAFSSVRMGVRAHIQHLKAYANTEPLREEVVDPRFHFITRGIAPQVEQLAGRWASDPNYGDRILSILRQLYEASGLL